MTAADVLSLVSVAVLVVGACFGVVREARSSAARAGVAALFFASQTAIVVFLLYVLRLGGDEYPSWIYAIAFAMSVFSVVATILLMRGVEGVGRRKIEAARMRALREQMGALRSYEDQLARERDRSRAMRLRIVESLREAERLLEEDDSGKAVDRASSAVDFARGAHAWRTGELVIDALLTRKKVLCGECGVRFSARVDLRGVDGSIETPVLVALFANSIDNAIASSRVAPPDRRFVEVRSRIESGMLLIDVRNGCPDDAAVPPEPDESDDERLFAEDADGDSIFPEHGWGVRIMRSLVRRSEGSFRMGIADGVCRVAIGIPMAGIALARP